MLCLQKATPMLDGEALRLIVDADQPGLTVEPFEVIAPHPIGRLRFKDCFVPTIRC